MSGDLLRSSPLAAFLKAEDLDDLGRRRDRVSSVTPQESNAILSVIQEWSDRQAVANLLFYPDLIPTSARIEALDRALRSDDFPYFALAAMVALQEVGLDDLPENKRVPWVQAVMRLVQSTSSVLAERASATLFRWAQRPVPHDILPELLSLYPVTNECACRNILSAALARCADFSPEELDQRLVEWRVPPRSRMALQAVHQEYRQVNARGEFRAMLMKSPAFGYIPNLSEWHR